MSMTDSFRKSGKEMPVDAPASLPSNFVDAAEQVILKVSTPTNNKGIRKFGITTSKIRNLLSLAIEIYHQEYLRTEPKLLEDSVYRIQMMRVRMAYEGRRDGGDKSVKQFLEESKLIPYLNDIGDDRMKLIRYTQYLEALVAYHCYYGGREN